MISDLYNIGHNVKSQENMCGCIDTDIQHMYTYAIYHFFLRREQSM